MTLAEQCQYIEAQLNGRMNNTKHRKMLESILQSLTELQSLHQTENQHVIVEMSHEKYKKLYE